MAPDPDPDDERLPGGPPLPPEDRLWRHPSEMGRSLPLPVPPVVGGAGALAPATVRRTSARGVLAGACLAGALVAFGALLLTRPVPVDDQRRASTDRSIPVSLSVTVTSLAAPVAIAAHPIPRAQVLPIGGVPSAAPGRLRVEVTDAAGPPAVVTVEPDGPADRSGLRPGDVIMAVDTTPVADAAELLVALAPTRPGQTVTLSVRRSGEQVSVSVELG